MLGSSTKGIVPVSKCSRLRQYKGSIRLCFISEMSYFGGKWEWMKEISVYFVIKTPNCRLFNDLEVVIIIRACAAHARQVLLFFY